MEVRGDSKKITRLLRMRGSERITVDDELVASIRKTIEDINASGGSCIKLAFLETIRRDLTEGGEWFNYQILLSFPKAEEHIKYLGHEFLEIGHILQKLENNIPENIMTFDEVKIETGAGKINIQSLNTQGLYLELGAGDVYIENLIVAKEAKIDGGARKNRNKIL